MTARILVVDDEESWSSLVREILRPRGYEVVVAGDADEAIQSARLSPPDLVILDVQLKGLTGLQVCELLRKDPATASVPILMLTVLKKEQDRVKGLQTGADDYLSKPFGHEELAARVMALLRRARDRGGFERELRANTLVVNVDRREVTVNGKPVALRPKEFALLVLLMEKQGRALTKEFLTTSVWGDDAIVTDDTLAQHVKNLRSKLGPCAAYLETVETIGYKLIVR